MMIFVAAVLWLALFCVAFVVIALCRVWLCWLCCVVCWFLVSKNGRTSSEGRGHRRTSVEITHNPSHPQHEHQQVNEFWDVSRVYIEYVEGAPLSS